MASLSLKHIYKVYPNGAKAVNDFNMEIEDKEFIVFVGPSGCGKSTTLRMIAGLEDITAGELRIGDRVVNDMEPKDRDIAMVFQNYALYPHMTVYDNIAFGLMMQKVPKDVIHERVLRAAEILGITEYLGRKPKEMSGGQRQRVSLGRAIVREPKVMLLDEPLSNLDAKLRTQMRTEISKLHKQLNTTFIYVTHDQVEAMTMGTRIVVMKNGFVQQIDTPKNLYKYPANKFVAGFIGTPQMNFFEGTLMRKGDVVEIAFEGIDTKLTAPYSYFHKAHPDFMKGDRPICLGLRSENVSLDPSIVAAGDAIVQVKVSNKEELGNEKLVYGNLVSGEKVGARIVIKTNNDVEYETDEVISVALDLNNLHLFSSETEERILPRIPECNYIDCKTEDGKISLLGQTLTLPTAIRPTDGDGDFVLPSDALHFGEGLKVEVVENERIGDQVLVSLLVGNKRLFMVTDREAELGEVSVAIDWKKVGFFREGDELVVRAPQTVTFDGGFEKRKVVKLDENGKKRKVVEFYLKADGAEFMAPDEQMQSVLATLDMKKTFSKPFRFECSCYDVRLGENGIKAQVLRMADYGTEKFAVCQIGEKEVYVSVDKDVQGEVSLMPALDKIAVIQADIDVRIV